MTMHIGDKDRRKFHRTMIATPVIVNFQSSIIQGSLVDISMGGLAAEFDLGVILNAEVEARLKPDAVMMLDIPQLKLRGLTATISRVTLSSRGYTIAIRFPEAKIEVAQRIIRRIVE